jgi:hypothetical protein
VYEPVSVREREREMCVSTLVSENVNELMGEFVMIVGVSECVNL